MYLPGIKIYTKMNNDLKTSVSHEFNCEFFERNIKFTVYAKA